MLLFLSQAWADITISHTLENQYLQGQPIVFDLRIFNDGHEMVRVPDLSKDRSKLQFVLLSGTEQLKIQSEPGTAATLNLSPRQLQELQFSLPNSAALKKGQHELTLQINFPTPITIKHQFEVLTPKIQSVDMGTLSEDHAFNDRDLLWQQYYNKEFNLLYKNLEQPQLITKISPNVQVTQSIGPIDSNHIYQIHNQSIQYQTISGRHISDLSREIPIPWPKATIFERGITDDKKRLLLPTWVPSNDNSGTIYMTILDHQQMASYRKIQNSTPPIHSDVALTQTNIPLLLLHHAQGVDLFVLTETGDAKIDKLPPKSHRLQSSNPNKTILDAQFAISPDKGLVAYILTEKSLEQDKSTQSTKIWTVEIYSIQGNLIEERTLSPLENQSYSQSQFNQIFTMLTKVNHQWKLLHNDQWIAISVPTDAQPILSIEDQTVWIYHFDTTLHKIAVTPAESSSELDETK